MAIGSTDGGKAKSDTVNANVLSTDAISLVERTISDRDRYLPRGEPFAVNYAWFRGIGSPPFIPDCQPHQNSDLVLARMSALALNRPKADSPVTTRLRTLQREYVGFVQVTACQTLNASASLFSNAAQSPRHALPCIQASVRGPMAARRASVGLVSGPWAK